MRIRLEKDEVVAGDERGGTGSRFHTFPSLTLLSDGSLWCAYLEGSEKSGPDGRLRCRRRPRGGRRWEPAPSPADGEGAESGFSYVMCHAVETSPGHLLGVYQRVDRSDPSAPLFHPRTSGMRPAWVKVARSTDAGGSWSTPCDVGRHVPDLFVPGKPLLLPDGTIGLPGEVWHEWERGFIEGPAALMLETRDGGSTWVRKAVMARDPCASRIYGDPRLAILSGGRIFCLCWTYSLATGEDAPVHAIDSTDGGRSWSTPRSTGLVAQIASPLALDYDTMLCIYQRRFGDGAGIRGILSHDAGGSFEAESDTLLWRSPTGVASQDPFAGYAGYAFGYSSAITMGDQRALIVFWAANGPSTCIRILEIVVG